MDGLGAGKCTTNHSKAHHHKSIPALAKGLKNIKLDSPLVQSPYTRDLHGSTSSFGTVPGSQPFKPEPQRASSAESSFTIDSSWDVVDDLPIRWAMDYVPLAPPGTRLCGTSVVSYDLWREFNERRRGAAYLAVVIKSNILLYHAPKGERAFRFIKVSFGNLLKHPLFISYIPGLLHSSERTQCGLRATVCSRYDSKSIRRRTTNFA